MVMDDAKAIEDQTITSPDGGVLQYI